MEPETTAFLLFPLSHSLSPLCLFQLLNLTEGHFTDKQEESFLNVSCSTEQCGYRWTSGPGTKPSSALKLALEQSFYFANPLLPPF